MLFNGLMLIYYLLHCFCHASYSVAASAVIVLLIRLCDDMTHLVTQSLVGVGAYIM